MLTENGIYTLLLLGWLSVDPLTDKYPSLSGYNYCANNPVMLVDPDGRAFGPFDRVQSAYNMIGTKYKQETSNNLRTDKTQQAMEYMDCTEFVARVMADDGITENVQNIGGRTRVQGFFFDEAKFENDFTPQIGDVAGWEGHWGIVSDVDNNGNIKLTHAANQKKGAIENGSFIPPSKYSSGKFLGFFRPKVETEEGKVTPKSGSKIADKNNIPIKIGALSEVSVMGKISTYKPSGRIRVEVVKPNIENINLK